MMQDFSQLIDSRIEEAVLNNYKQLPQFIVDCSALLASLDVTKDGLNEYLNAAVAKGVSAETAMDCYTLSLQIPPISGESNNHIEF